MLRSRATNALNAAKMAAPLPCKQSWLMQRHLIILFFPSANHVRHIITNPKLHPRPLRWRPKQKRLQIIMRQIFSRRMTMIITHRPLLLDSLLYTIIHPLIPTNLMRSFAQNSQRGDGPTRVKKHLMKFRNGKTCITIVLERRGGKEQSALVLETAIPKLRMLGKKWCLRSSFPHRVTAQWKFAGQ